MLVRLITVGGGLVGALHLHANVLGLVLKLRLRDADRAFERHIASVQRLLHIQQVLGDKLLQSEELKEIGLREPTKICDTQGEGANVAKQQEGAKKPGSAGRHLRFSVAVVARTFSRDGGECDASKLRFERIDVDVAHDTIEVERRDAAPVELACSCARRRGACEADRPCL